MTREKVILGTVMMSLLVSICVATGCGGEKKPSDEAQIKAVANDYSDAVADQDAGRVCKLYTPKPRAKFNKIGGVAAGGGQSGCEAFTQTVLDKVGASGGEGITNVDLDGSRAHATAKSGASIPMQKVGDDWQVAGVPTGSAPR